jgi:outer membrane autotransporter protein
MNTYSGGTTISAGVLQVGNGGTTGSIPGNVIDNAALIFDRADMVSFGGTISGTGTLMQIGTGNLTLTGTNSYSGGTTISAGTLTGSATSFGSGSITDNAALVINQPVDAAIANAINGTGSFTKQGAGRLNYTGTGSLSGPTTVAAGLLSVNGNLANSAVTVQNGASLGGNGTVGATTVQSGGTIAPGNSIGTLHINGSFVQNAGSIYNVELDPNTNVSDRILVNGTATLQSGAGLNVIKYVPGEYQLGTVYTVLTASGGVNGTYAVSGQTAGVSAFLGLKDSYDANNVYLRVIQTQPLDSVAETPNQQAVADAIQTLPPVTNPATGAITANPVQTAVLNLPDAPSARAAFDQLSGQSQASAQGALLANGLYVRDVAFDRLRDVVCTAGDVRQKTSCDGKKLSIWEQGFGGWGGIAGNGNATGLNHSAAGFLVGVDIPVEDVRLGFFGGYSHSDFNVVTGDALGDSNDYHLGVYGGTLLEGIALRLGTSYSWSGITTDRAVAFGSFSDLLHGIYNAGTTQAFGELGYGVDLGGVSLEPFANLTYVSLHTTGFTEAGGAAALTVNANTIDDTITTLGVRPSMDVALYGFEGTLRGMAGWRHTFGTITPTSQVSFAGGNFFDVGGASLARDAAALEAGLDVTLEEGMTLGLTYGGQFSSRTTDQTARGTIRISF